MHRANTIFAAPFLGALLIHASGCNNSVEEGHVKNCKVHPSNPECAAGTDSGAETGGGPLDSGSDTFDPPPVEACIPEKMGTLDSPALYQCVGAADWVLDVFTCQKASEVPLVGPCSTSPLGPCDFDEPGDWTVENGDGPKDIDYEGDDPSAPNVGSCCESGATPVQTTSGCRGDVARGICHAVLEDLKTGLADFKSNPDFGCGKATKCYDRVIHGLQSMINYLTENFEDFDKPDKDSIACVNRIRAEENFHFENPDYDGDLGAGAIQCGQVTANWALSSTEDAYIVAEGCNSSPNQAPPEPVGELYSCDFTGTVRAMAPEGSDWVSMSGNAVLRKEHCQLDYCAWVDGACVLQDCFVLDLPPGEDPCNVLGNGECVLNDLNIAIIHGIDRNQCYEPCFFQIEDMTINANNYNKNGYSGHSMVGDLVRPAAGIYEVIANKGQLRTGSFALDVGLEGKTPDTSGQAYSFRMTNSEPVEVFFDQQGRFRIGDAVFDWGDRQVRFQTGFASCTPITQAQQQEPQASPQQLDESSEKTTDGGCGCHASRQRSQGSLAGLLGLAFAWVARRRRRIRAAG